MPEIARRFASKLRQFINDRRHAKRRSARLPITVSLNLKCLTPNGTRHYPTMNGHTIDVSTTGLSFVVPAIRIGEHYFTGPDRKLLLKVDLPERPVEMQVSPVRYESLDENETEKGYVVGVFIVEMSEEDRAGFDLYVNKLQRHRII